PNTTRGIINIIYNFEDSKPITIKVYNLTGKKVGEYNSTSAGIYSIDLSDQVNGIYMISIQTRENIITKKFIINKGF
ncbi:MAG: T9SS type A sorting domain-containing protein, partial [Bacteroidetes bacterium]|nr:T9SS type A sorting domain-containing protein [Bacteroidota bacterium]